MDGDGGEHSHDLLAALIDLERRIDAEIVEAEAEAERIVEAARQKIASDESGRDTRAEAALASLRESIECEHSASVRSIEDRAAADAARYRSFPEDAIEGLARWLAQQVAEGGSGT